MKNKYPDWLLGAWTEALNYFSKDESLAESALGLAGMVSRGNVTEARRVYESGLQRALILRRMAPHLPGELGSTQLRHMVNSNRYPRKFRDEIRGRLK